MRVNTGAWSRARIATPFQDRCPCQTASYPAVRRAFPGNSPCSALSSWRLTTSGSVLANQERRLSSRLLMLLMLNVATLNRAPAAAALPAVYQTGQANRNCYGMARYTRVTSARVLWLKSLSQCLDRLRAGLYLVSRRFRQEAASRQQLPDRQLPIKIGLSASEGQPYRCPVSHPIPVKNHSIQASRSGGIFIASFV
jgi:hypothetical protein